MHKPLISFYFLFASTVLGPSAHELLEAQPLSLEDRAERDKRFPDEKPGLGDQFPSLTVYTPDGKEINTQDLRGHYTVLTFGCLT